MFIIKPEAVKVFARMKVRELEFEVSPMSREFYNAQSQEPDESDSGLVHRVIDEIEETVADLANVYQLQQLRYKFWPGRDRIVQECAGTLKVPWKYKFLIQNRLIWKGYFYEQSAEVSCLDPLLEPFADTGQRYRAEFDLDQWFTSVIDRQENITYDPRELFDIGSSEYMATLHKGRLQNTKSIISDLGGTDRAFALHFFRLRCASGEYTLEAAKSSFDTGLGF